MIMMMLLIKSRETPNIIWVLSILSDLSVAPTWCRNDVGAEALPRHGAKAMSGQRCCPDMAQKRCRARGVSPTWQKSDVGPEVFPRHGTKAMSGWRRCPDMAKKRCRYSHPKR